MSNLDPLKDLPGVQAFQERAIVRAVRLTRENADEIALRARMRVNFTPEGKVMLCGHNFVIWALEGDVIFARPGSMRLSVRTEEDFAAWYTRPGKQLTEEDLG